jgi:hypothetical protein
LIGWFMMRMSKNGMRRTEEGRAVGAPLRRLNAYLM